MSTMSTSRFVRPTLSQVVTGASAPPARANRDYGCIRITGFRLRALAIGAVLSSMFMQPADAIDFVWSGFASGVVGDVISGAHQSFLGYDCPCFIADWEHAGVYDRRGPMVAPESVGGLQGTLTLYPSLAATVQMVARASTERVTADWAYLTYTITPEWQVKAGRQRLPLYSDSSSIGYSYPWIRPAPEVYGWEIYDYDGGSTTYRGELGDWSLDGSAYMGRRSVANNVMESKVTYGYQVDEAWDKILGGTLELTNYVVTARLVFQNSKVDRYLFPPDAPPTQSLKRTPQQFIDFALSVDDNGVILRSEVQSLRQIGADLDPFSYLLSGGYRYGSVTGMLMHAWYYERRTTGDSEPQRFHTNTATLRWDFHQSWDAKIQFDLFQDASAGSFIGGSRLLTFAIDTVF